MCCSTQEFWGLDACQRASAPQGGRGKGLGSWTGIGACQRVLGLRGGGGRDSPLPQARNRWMSWLGAPGAFGHSPQDPAGLPRSAEAGGYWQSMNASNRCASCSGADVSSMHGAGAECTVPACATGAAGHACSAVIMHSPLPSPPGSRCPSPAGPAPGSRAPDSEGYRGSLWCWTLDPLSWVWTNQSGCPSSVVLGP